MGGGSCQKMLTVKCCTIISALCCTSTKLSSTVDYTPALPIKHSTDSKGNVEMGWRYMTS